MILICPQCDTRFSVPDSALGHYGRTVRCARCAHKWLATAPSAATASGTATPPPPPPAPTSPPRMQIPPARDEFDIPLESPGAEFAAARLASPEDDEDGAQTGSDAPIDFGAVRFDDGGDDLLDDAADDPFAKISEFMMSNKPDDMPDVFSTPPPPKRAPRRKGGAVLIIVGVILALAAIAAGLYFGRDPILAQFPGLGPYYDKLHVRRDDVVGFGLAFRNITADRNPENGTEVLIVRGIIENSTAQVRAIPLLSLVLYNNKTIVQEKVVNPPQAKLDPKATVGFSLTLEQPDASATRFELTFTVAKDASPPSTNPPPTNPTATTPPTATNPTATSPAAAK